MPRKSDTADRVLEVADRLLEQGIRPTQQNVREQIGSGSISTINRALNEWWQQLGVRLRENRERPDLPEPVLEGANRLWQQALGYADHVYKERKAELDERYKAIQTEAQAAKSYASEELDSLREQNIRLLEERELAVHTQQDLRQQILQLESNVIRLNGEKSELEREVKQHALMLDRSPSVHSAAIDTQALIELKVALRLSQEECSRLEVSQQSLTDENAVLRKQMQQLEKEAMSKRHGLETVIAQQDVRYDQALNELQECRRQLSDKQS